MASGGQVFGCGQCLPCRINRRRMWTHRIMLETTQHPHNTFVTLTYDDENLPRSEDGVAILKRDDLTRFMKRLRWHHHPSKLRYFNVGEYGEQSWRPHYHLALFNHPSCTRGMSQFNRQGNCCSVCDGLREIWGKGIVHSGKLEDSSAAYLAGYITKKLTQKGDPRLEGRPQEFATMSLRPGIGAGFMSEVASTLLEHGLEVLPDVPTALRHGAYTRPLGRYLTRQLRKQVGLDENAPQATLQAQQDKMSPLREAARQIAPLKGYTEALKSIIIETNEGRYQRLLGKATRHKKRGSI